MGTEHGQESTHEAESPEGGDPPDGGSKFEDVLAHLEVAMALVATATHALEAAQNDGECSTVGAEITTLQEAVEALTAVHEELDLAILGVEL
jgi:hypothetical protein